MVSIVAFQAVDPGSIPGPRIAFATALGQWPYLVSPAERLLSLVVEHSLCKRKVGGSIPPVGCWVIFLLCWWHTMGRMSTERALVLVVCARAHVLCVIVQTVRKFGTRKQNKKCRHDIAEI